MASEIVRVSHGDGYNTVLSPDLLDNETMQDWFDRFKDLLGTNSRDVAEYVLDIVSKATRYPSEKTVNTLLATIINGHPRDPQELMLLTQMACVSHIMTDNLLKASEHRFDPVDQDAVARIVARYGYLYARQMEALRKYRKAAPNITVLNANQAIVGNVRTK